MIFDQLAEDIWQAMEIYKLKTESIENILTVGYDLQLCHHQLVEYLKEYDTDLSIFGKFFMQGEGESMEQQKDKCN